MNRFAAYFLLFALLLPAAFGQRKPTPDKRGALYPSLGSDVIPHLTHGATWQSTLIIVNVSKDTSFYRIKFYSPDGKEAKFKTRDQGETHELYGTLAPGGSTRISSIADSSSKETRYWAELVDGAGKIQVTVLFGWRVPGNTPMDVSVPNTDNAALDAIYFPFDNTNGYKTAYAFANSSSWTTSEFQIEARNENGVSIFTTNATLAPRNQIAELLPDKYPQLANQKGVIVLKPTSGSSYSLIYCAPLVLQFHPSGSVTYIPAYDEY